MNCRVDNAGRGRGWQRSPRTLVHSFVVPTHVPRSVMDTSVTAHCHAAPAQLTRAYQSDHRRHVLTPTTTRAVHQPISPRHSLTTPSISGVRSEVRAEQRLAPGGRSPHNPDKANCTRRVVMRSCRRPSRSQRGRNTGSSKITRAAAYGPAHSRGGGTARDRRA